MLSHQLEELDRQEDRFLDPIGDPDWPQGKIKTRLQKVRESKQRITHQLANTTDDLEPGRAVLLAGLELLDRPHDLYDNATDNARKLLNKAIFTRLYLDSTDRRPIATAETLSEPNGSLVNAVRAMDGRSIESGAPNADIDAEGRAKHLAGLLTLCLEDQSASKPAMVELRRLELLTPSMRTRCATSCATAPSAGNVSTGRVQAPNRHPEQAPGLVRDPPSSRVWAIA